MAYVSDVSGQPEVYVHVFSANGPFPANGPGRQISTAGGDLPRRKHDGKELYYIASDKKLMAIRVKTGGAPSVPFESELPQPLFVVEPIGGSLITSRYPYQPAVDGQRFLVNVLVGGEAASAPPITVVVNWEDGLKK
jgi:hypothetical protein